MCGVVQREGRGGADEHPLPHQHSEGAQPAFLPGYGPHQDHDHLILEDLGSKMGTSFSSSPLLYQAPLTFHPSLHIPFCLLPGRELLRPWAVGSYEYLIAFRIRKRAGQLQPQQVREKENRKGWDETRGNRGRKSPRKRELISVLPEVRPGLGRDGAAQSQKPSGSSRLGESWRQTLHSTGSREGELEARFPWSQEAAVPGIARAQGGGRGE